MRMMTSSQKKRYLVISDLQIPFHHEQAVKNLIKLVKREKFDLILNTGDELDMQSQSKWAKGTHLEYEGQLDYDRSLAQNILSALPTSLDPTTPIVYTTLSLEELLASSDFQNSSTPALWVSMTWGFVFIKSHSSSIKAGS
jgi:hypothetical protein